MNDGLKSIQLGLVTNEEALQLEQLYRFERIPRKKQIRIIEILGYCKEIRNTAYPMKNSNVTELEIVEFIARKEKDIYYINGSLQLRDGDRRENRILEAYILENNSGVTAYVDITRLCVEDEPKMIRTSENFLETETNVMSVTKYAGCGYFEEKVYSEEFPLPERRPKKKQKTKTKVPTI